MIFSTVQIQKSFFQNVNLKKENYIKSRITIVIIFFFIMSITMVVRLIQYTQTKDRFLRGREYQRMILPYRPDILDRNGQILAIDIKTYSLFANPHRISNVHHTAKILSEILKDLSFDEIVKKLMRNSDFSWIRRGLTFQQRNEILKLKIPGIDFRKEFHRFYPGGPTASHLLGLVDVDNQGIAGIEKYIDQMGLLDLRNTGLATYETLKPISLSLDVRIQTIVRNELEKSIKRYNAIAAGAVVLNARTGEVIAMSSLPDYDINHPWNVLKPDRFNRMTAGIFEMGSVMKSFTTAMALDSGMFHIDSIIDVSKPLKIGNYIIRDFHGKYRPLVLWEVFVFSSNIGSGKEAAFFGISYHRKFLKKFGLLDRMKIELPEIAHPMEPNKWRKINSITISFGHGMTTTPLQTAVAASALMNGGFLLEPTLFIRNEEDALQKSKKVIKDSTSQIMRCLYYLNVKIGSGKYSSIRGYYVGGKTGTAEKIFNRKYSKIKKFNTFISSFPIYDPSYVVLIILDEPHSEKNKTLSTAALNAAVISKEIIRKSSGFLGISPDY